jgi:hypothetical protein
MTNQATKVKHKAPMKIAQQPIKKKKIKIAMTKATMHHPVTKLHKEIAKIRMKIKAK